MIKRLYPFAACLLVLAFSACQKDTLEPVVDPLPFPSELETYKDLSVDPGDSFFDYCNGSRIRSMGIPEKGAIGGAYDAQGPMDQRVEELKASVPDLRRFYELMDNMYGEPEKSRAYIDSRKALYPKPSTREEAFLTMGRMIMDGVAPWVKQIPRWDLIWKDGKVVGLLYPPTVTPGQSATNPEELVYLSDTKADDASALRLIVRGMGLEVSHIVTDPSMAAEWSRADNSSLEELCQSLEDVWESYDVFESREILEQFGLPEEYVTQKARLSLNYTLSYHLAERFISPADKEKYLRITKEIQASLRKRIQAVDWMSETTRNNALDKLDNYGLYVAYPDQWHTDCIPTLADCETLVEAVDRNNRGLARLKSQLLGTNDGFSTMIIRSYPTGVGNNVMYCDLSLVNALYDPEVNGVYIYPAILLPPIMPANVSDACTYAAYMVIGHEFTHGFDSLGSQFDKLGNQHNWWTVADQMAFEDRCQNLVQCYSHMELDPERAPGVYCDGNRTLSENIADLGGFLTVLDAYEARLKAEGYSGKALDDQLRKFFEYFAHFWCVEYSDAAFDVMKTLDTHSHARLRVNGVVMNTDLWYRLYNVTRDNYLYLPPERRTYIW